MKDFSYKNIWLVAYPIIISLVMEQLIGMTDTAFMGRVGEVELGASAIAGVFYLVIFLAAMGFSVGAQILIGRRNGEGEYKAIGNVFYQGIFFLFSLAVVLFTLTQCFSGMILDKLVSSADVAEKAESYIEWRVYGFFFSFVATMFRAFYVGTTQTKTLTLNSMVMVIANIIFNYILIFGKFGLPAYGIAGAGMGSSLAELVSLIFFIVYTRRKIDYKKYGLNLIPKVKIDELKKILGISTWIMVQNFFSISTWFIFYIYVEHLGELPLAITNVIRSLSGFPFMILVGIASSCSSMVSNMIGGGHNDKVGMVINRHMKLCFLIITPLLVIIAIFPELFLSIYTDIEEVIVHSVPALWVMCISYLFQIPSQVYFSSISGTGNTKTAFGIEMFTLLCYMIYITITILVLRIDVTWAWSSECIYATVMFTLSYKYLKSGKWEGRQI